MSSASADEERTTIADRIEIIEDCIRAAVSQQYPHATFSVRHQVRGGDETRSVGAITAVPSTPVDLPTTVVPAGSGVAISSLAPSAPATIEAPAGWRRDPAGRHESRYWNGLSWTEYVMNSGQLSVDWLRTCAS